MASPQHQPVYSREESETTEYSEEYDIVDYTACLEVSLGMLPSGSQNLEAYCAPHTNLPLPRLPGVIFRHFALTFDDKHVSVLKDLQ